MLSIAETINRLHQAGWALGLTGFLEDDDSITWIVSGIKGEHMIRASGKTKTEAWQKLIKEARRLGLLKRKRA